MNSIGKIIDGVLLEFPDIKVYSTEYNSKKYMTFEIKIKGVNKIVDVEYWPNDPGDIIFQDKLKGKAKVRIKPAYQQAIKIIINYLKV